MKATTQLTLAIVAASSLLVSCNKSSESTDKTSPNPPPAPVAPATPLDQAKEFLGKLTSGIEKVVVALESVTDKASAETAATTIKSVSAEISTLGPQAKELEVKLSKADKTAMAPPGANPQ